MTAAVAAGAAQPVAAIAQTDPKVGVTVNDPIGPVPDPARVTATLPEDFKCRGTSKQEMCILFSDPAKPGPYMVMFWYPSNFSSHYHSNVHWVYVVRHPVDLLQQRL